jgi:hypothetical protein
MSFIFRPTRLIERFVENKREKYQPLSCDKTVEAVFIGPFGPEISGSFVDRLSWILADLPSPGTKY